MEEEYPQRRQEFIKMMGRRKQEEMANELSRQACEAYADDIVKHMEQMEVNCHGFTFTFLFANHFPERNPS